MAYTLKYLSTADWAGFRNLTPSATTTPTLVQVTSFIEQAEKELDATVADYGLKTGVDVIYKGLAHGVSIQEPVTVVNTVEISNGDLITPTWSELPSTDFVLKQGGRVLLRNPYINREYRANIDSGYAIADVPQEIKYLVYLMSMRGVFNAHLFTGNISDNVTRIVDVEVYRQITKGGDPFKGFGALDIMINEAKANIKGKLRTRLG